MNTLPSAIDIRSEQSYDTLVPSDDEGQEFPFSVKLSFQPLIEKIKEDLNKPHTHNRRMIEEVLAAVGQIPELNTIIDDVDILQQHRPVVAELMSLVFPATVVEHDYKAAILPFKMDSFCSSRGMEKIINFKGKQPNSIPDFTSKEMFIHRMVGAYALILHKVYGLPYPQKPPFIFTVEDEDTGLSQHFQLNFSTEFVKVKPVTKLPPLSKSDLTYLRKNISNIAVLQEHLPPENFEFQGFVLVNCTDITEIKSLSSLKDELMEKDALRSEENFEKLQSKIRDLFKLPGLKLGLTAFNSEHGLWQSATPTIWKSFVSKEGELLACSTASGCLYDLAYNGESMVIEDITESDQYPILEDLVKREGIQSLLVSPLTYGDEFIGLVELGSPNPGDLNFYSIAKLKDVLSIFSLAVKRSIEDTMYEVEAIKQKEFTAIHPTVAWKFNEVAYKYKAQKDNGEMPEIEPIVFEDVHPLFGQTDIRHSSMHRSLAIRDDLLQQLNGIKEVLQVILKKRNFPIYQELLYRVEQNIQEIQPGLGAGDESSVLDFIRTRVETVFETVRNLDSEVREAVIKYQEMLDPELKLVYNCRKSFEQSLTRINEEVSSFLNEKEEEAQTMFPHYFEKYKTDGVEFNIYVGASLVPNQPFDPIYLENLRLWQLQVMAEITRITEKLKPKLAIELSTTQLILVQSMPLAIRFRQEEKQFDVDGAYNVRYEIVKKRIDKAKIKGTDERLTQPDKIAIVYSNEKEIEDYYHYIKFLQNQGFLEDTVEKFELEELPGASGLKALRVGVKYES